MLYHEALTKVAMGEKLAETDTGSVMMGAGLGVGGAYLGAKHMGMIGGAAKGGLGTKGLLAGAAGLGGLGIAGANKIRGVMDEWGQMDAGARRGAKKQIMQRGMDLGNAVGGKQWGDRAGRVLGKGLNVFDAATGAVNGPMRKTRATRVELAAGSVSKIKNSVRGTMGGLLNILK